MFIMSKRECGILNIKFEFGLHSDSVCQHQKLSKNIRTNTQGIIQIIGRTTNTKMIKITSKIQLE